jgi:AraC-like DNA-binding protein
MLLVDAFFRFTALGLIAFQIILTWRDLPQSKSKTYFILASLSLFAWLLSFTPDALNLPYYLRLILRILDVPQLIFVWLFALSLFQKDFKAKSFHLIIALAFCVPVFAERLLQFGFIEPLPRWVGHWINLTALTIMAHMIGITLKERSDDLLEKRRKSRLIFVYVVALIILLIVIISFTVPILHMGRIQPTANMLVIWPAIMLFSYWLFSVKGDTFAFEANLKENDEKKELDFRDSELQKKLDDEFIQNTIYLQNNLSIPVLASKLGVSKYRLRDFIQTLGYENFSTYVNTFRIKAVKNEFKNPEKKHIPILAIALNKGFNSLSPFNRSIKSIVWVTPSQYRKKLDKTQID